MAGRRKTLDDWEAERSNEPQAWLTPKEAAEHLRIGVSSLAKMRMANEGPEFNQPFPNSIRYSRDALDAWMQSKHAKTK